jgi:hypothetical protein
MKDFVNSHNLPIVSPPSGTSGFSSRKQEVNAIIPDDLSRGGHASLKKMVDRNDFNDTTAISKEVTTNSSEEPLEDVTQQPNVLREASKQVQTLDVHLNHLGEEKQKKLWNSAARIAKKLKVRIVHREHLEWISYTRFHLFPLLHSHLESQSHQYSSETLAYGFWIFLCILASYDTQINFLKFHYWRIVICISC